MFINFSDLPGQQNLFLDYLYEFENVKEFYKKDFRDKTAYTSLFEELSSKQRPHREKVYEIVKQQYKTFYPSRQTLNNIELLKNRKTIAIVTGQQLGLYGGPLYTYFKITTALKLCRSFSEKYPSYHFVPLFWLEGDDHDFDEVRSANTINDNYDLITFTYNDGLPEETNRGSVGNIKFNENINSLNAELSQSLRDNDFKGYLLEKLTSFYSEGKSFKQAFRELMFLLFDESGLVIFDPQDHGIKEILKDVFKKEIKGFSEHTKELVKTSAGLEDIYHAQVKVNPINLFLSDQDGRYLIEPVDGDFRLKGKRKKMSKEALLEILENEPERFSPNVLLRPICQDYLFPTLAYIAGPGEISYFAQVIPLYRIFDVCQPVIYPRASVTLLEKSIRKIIDKFGLGYMDLFTEKEVLYEKIISAQTDFEIDTEFGDCEKNIADALTALKDKLVLIDPTLEDVTSRTNDKIAQSMKILKDKTSEAQKRRYDISLRQINKASNLVYPESKLQERELSIIYFAHKYGLDIIKRISDDVEIEKFEHQLLEI